jgi:hypothetical protein
VEAEAVDRLGIPNVIVDHDSLVRDDEFGRAVRWVPEQPEPVLAAYRGWMVTPPQYRGLYVALSAKNIWLINDPEQYRHGHHLPENYPVIRGHTPRSVWVTGDRSMDRIMEALATFGDAPVVLKDFVKSRKHEWAEACFIPRPPTVETWSGSSGGSSNSRGTISSVDWSFGSTSNSSRSASTPRARCR